jgi:hypothetical protein
VGRRETGVAEGGGAQGGVSGQLVGGASGGAGGEAQEVAALLGPTGGKAQGDRAAEGAP